MRLLTASKAGLAFKCSWWLRDDVPLDDSPAGPAAAEGTALHSLIEGVLLGATNDLDHLPPVVVAKFMQWDKWAKGQRRLGWRPEVAYAYHARSDSARELPQAHHRDYSDVRPGEVEIGRAHV